MSHSALLGTQPTQEDDRLIYKAINEVYPQLLAIVPPRQTVSHHSKAPGMLFGTAFAIIFVITITGARLWIRLTHSRSFGADDMIIIPAALGCLSYLALGIAQATAGCMGKHLWDCTYQQFRWFYELAHISLPLFYLTVFAVKISLVLANRRITGLTSPPWRLAHNTYLVLLTILGPICVLLNIFPCSPIATYFTLQSIAVQPDPRHIKCLDQGAISLATRYVHIITDWLLIPVPVIILWRLQMDRGRKMRLMGVFALGIISSVASIVRSVKTEQMARNVDVTYDYTPIYPWDIIDIFFATIVASLPALNGFLDRILPTLTNPLSTLSSLSNVPLIGVKPHSSFAAFSETYGEGKEGGLLASKSATDYVSVEGRARSIV